MKITTARTLARIFWYTVSGLAILLTLTCGGSIYWWAATSQYFIEGPGLTISEEIEGARAFDRSPPQWSYDGRLVAFSHNNAVYTMMADGSGLRRLAGEEDPKWIWDSDYGREAAQSPSISPDGSRIAYVAFKHDRWWLPEIEDYQWDIVTSKIDGSDRRRLTKSGGNFSPSWSPVGSRIAFIGRGLEIMDSDGSNRRTVVSGIRIAADRSPPVWSPDGRRLAFIAREPDSPDGAWRDPVTRQNYPVEEVLYTVGADGMGLTRIGEAKGTSSWSPDGSRIAFARIDGNTHVAIVTTDPDGSNEQTVFESSEVRNSGVIDVSWSPDGTRIAIKDLLIRGGTSGQGRVTISVVDADGSGPPRLIALNSGRGGLSWSPDGSRIALHYPDADSPGAAVKTIAAVELPEQDEFWYRWDEGEGGRDATPRPTPTLAQPKQLAPAPQQPVTSTSSLKPGPSSQGTSACVVDSDASCTPRDVSGFGLFSAGGGAADPEPVAAFHPPRSTGRVVSGTC